MFDNCLNVGVVSHSINADDNLGLVGIHLLYQKRYRIYCKFGNFSENLIFAKSVKIHIKFVTLKFSTVGHDLTISEDDRVISPFPKVLFSRNFAFAKIYHSRNFRIYIKFTSIFNDYIRTYTRFYVVT